MSILQSGNLVKVRAYGDTVLTRRCAGVEGSTVLICNETEYKAALEEKRQPVCIGFPITDVVEFQAEGETESDSEFRPLGT